MFLVIYNYDLRSNVNSAFSVLLCNVWKVVLRGRCAEVLIKYATAYKGFGSNLESVHFLL